MININSADLAKRYAGMSDEELAEVRRSDLTPQAASVYDQELTRRSPIFARELQDRNSAAAEAAARREAAEPPSDPKPELGLFAIISICFFALGCVLVLFLYANDAKTGTLPAFITIACFPGMLLFNSYMQQKRAWNDRRKDRQSREQSV